MKIQILSDLHLEFENLDLPENDSDVVVLAGDIHIRQNAIEWILKNIPNKPVVYIFGNHEFYGKSYPTLIDKVKALTQDTNIHILENESIDLGEVEFFGCTYWTDFELFGNPKIAGYHCQQLMTDYKRIRRAPSYSKLRSLDTAIINRSSVRWLQAAVSDSTKKKVVVTHHSPSLLSLPELRREKLESAAYVSNHDDLVRELSPSLWVHGHIHHSSDYRIGDTRVVCNPRGYPDNFNKNFDVNLMVEI